MKKVQSPLKNVKMLQSKTKAARQIRGEIKINGIVSLTNPLVTKTKSTERKVLMEKKVSDFDSSLGLSKIGVKS